MRYSPTVRRILLRAALFLVPGSSLWALLPLIATRRRAWARLATAGPARRAGGRRRRRRVPPAAGPGEALGQRPAAAASLVYAAALVAVALSRNLALTVLVLLPAGVAWIAFLSNVNAMLQLFLPQWLRCSAACPVYQMVLFGGQAAGAVIWGVAAAVGPGVGPPS